MKRRNTTACLNRAGAKDSIERRPALFGRGCGAARFACCPAITPGGRHQRPGARLGRSGGLGAVAVVLCKRPSPLHFQCSTLLCPPWRIPEVCQGTCRHYSGATTTLFHWRTDAPSVAAHGAKIRRRNGQSCRVPECLGLIPSSVGPSPFLLSLARELGRLLHRATFLILEHPVPSCHPRSDVLELVFIWISQFLLLL